MDGMFAVTFSFLLICPLTFCDHEAFVYDVSGPEEECRGEEEEEALGQSGLTSFSPTVRTFCAQEEVRQVNVDADVVFRIFSPHERRFSLISEK
ncbi:hypothetical protein PoB_000645500 [Plakobranchus ocellatus]|uniref:Uncharacterized protein n=1 Tax=Plakobranchus ocellatus TaxID=259542 RepID=A0AAV3YB18_9GAST|nr:hypothetical protein PoB_000645500 [Plakobranchus ocellatus]